MAAYAALVSLMQTIDEIKNHPRPPISLDEKQVHSITENIVFLQKFLEAYFKEEEEMEGRIADAAYAVEDVIESHIVDQIQTGSPNQIESIRFVDFYQRLEKVIQDMDLVKKKVMEIVEVKKMEAQLHHQLMISPNYSVSIGPVRRVSRMQKNIMVDFGGILNNVMYKLTRQEYNLDIIPIIGMGGIGKTTLAKHIYAHPLIVQHFHFLAWVTISQEYNVSQILSQVLSDEENKGGQVHELGERVHKKLYGRRYLIVMNDIWSIEAWDKVKSFLPKNNNGSKIMITTRLSNLAFQLSGSHDFQMKFLDDDKSWDLLCEIVFGKDGCPTELVDIGKEIARNCRGLPLSIVVIGGLLTKSNLTHDYWKYTLQNMSSLINLENKEHCLQILGSSYMELPMHLKPCFLYIGVFPEDHVIYVRPLIRLWVVEGILKPIENKSLEEVAKHYIKELVDRNLILVHKLSLNMKAKSFKIHDLLRDLCLREAKRQRFFCLLRLHDLNIPVDIIMERRICIHDNMRKEFPPKVIGEIINEVFDAVDSASLIRSLLLFDEFDELSPPTPSRLLRVYSNLHYYDSSRSCWTSDLSQANLRYLFVSSLKNRSIPWNLQTLHVRYPDWASEVEICDIWKMPHLRHVMIDGELIDPSCEIDDFVLEHLHALSIYDFKYSEEVVKRIPNIKKLKLFYNASEEWRLCHNNLGCLRNLTSLHIRLPFNIAKYSDPNTMQNLNFPYSLKKLSLIRTRFLWEDLTAKIGSLPLLQVLNLDYSSCIGPKWETNEGQFPSLKFLLIANCDLKCWATYDTHFPCLEHLVLEYLHKLEEIPLSMGDIPTLQSIKLLHCLKSAIASAERIKEEQLSYGNEDLQVLIEGIHRKRKR